MSVLTASALDGWDDARPALDPSDLLATPITRPRRRKHRRAWCAGCGLRLPNGSRETACPRCGEPAIVHSHAQAREWQDAQAREWGAVL